MRACLIASGICTCSSEVGPFTLGSPCGLERSPGLLYSQLNVPYLARRSAGALLVAQESSNARTFSIIPLVSFCTVSVIVWAVSTEPWHPTQPSYRSSKVWPVYLPVENVAVFTSCG